MSAQTPSAHLPERHISFELHALPLRKRVEHVLAMHCISPVQSLSELHDASDGVGVPPVVESSVQAFCPNATAESATANTTLDIE